MDELRLIAESHGISTRGMTKGAIIGRMIHNVNKLTETEKNTILKVSRGKDWEDLVEQYLKKDLKNEREDPQSA